MIRNKTIFATLVFSLLLASRIVEAKHSWNDDDQSELVELSWSQWLTHIVSRSVYTVLIFMISICIIITSIKNKGVDNDMVGAFAGEGDLMGEGEGSGWMDTLWKAASGGSPPALLTSTTGPQHSIRKLLYRTANDQTIEAETRLKDKLRDAEAAVTVLKQELDKSNKARLELENTLDAIDRDKETAEDKLECQKVQGALELEQLKREIDTTHRKLQKALKERDDLSQEVSSLQRDARIVSSALRDNQLMDVRLEEARREIEILKKQLADIQEEKESAAHVVQEIINSKHLASRSDHPSDILTTIGSSLEQDVGRKNLQQTEDLVKGFVEEIRRNIKNTETTKISDHQRNMDLGTKTCESEINEFILAAESREPTLFDTEVSGWPEVEEYGGGEDKNPGLVTGSQAFRHFLETTFTYEPEHV